MLEIRRVHKSYEGQPLLQGVSLTVGQAETLCLLGPSGSGKSTLLQIILGLDTPEAGQVLWEGTDLASTPPHQRDFGMVFQDYALFPHLDVAGNVAFGPRVKGWPRHERARRVAQVLELVNLSGFEHRHVVGLSGGEQQRVALARALAPRPRLLLFDEPLGALDRALRQELLQELRDVLLRTRIPAIYVTHDQEEAYQIADRIALLHEGRIVRAGIPEAVCRNPGSAWVAAFLGLGNVIVGRLVARQRLETPFGVLPLPCKHKHRMGERLHILARPRASPAGALFRGVVRDVTFRPDGYRIELAGGLYFETPKAHRRGRRTAVRLRVECLG
jgi:spermidine/putrescine transport system ATP-binding protein